MATEIAFGVGPSRLVRMMQSTMMNELARTANTGMRNIADKDRKHSRVSHEKRAAKDEVTPTQKVLDLTDRLPRSLIVVFTISPFR